MEDRCLLAAFVVDTVVDESDGNLSAGDLSLREAIEAANAEAGVDTISFSSTFFGTAQTINLVLGEFAITDELTITGPGRDLLTIDAQGNSRHFNIDDGDESNVLDVTISGLSLTNGHATDGNDGAFSEGDLGGALFAKESVTFEASTISGSSAVANGGGINSYTNLIVRASVISNNSAESGGGISAQGESTISGSRISKNSVSGRGGGGIEAFGQTLIEESMLRENSAGGDGGALISFGTTIVLRSGILDNLAGGSGGGIHSRQGRKLSVLGSTISGNRGREGGGVYVQGFNSDVAIVSSTLTANTSTNPDVGHMGGGISSRRSVATVSHSVVAGNLDRDGNPNDTEGTGARGSYNLIGDPGTAGWYEHGVNNNIVGQDDGSGARETLDISTVLGALADNGGFTQTHALLPGSIAVDAGDPNFDPNAFEPPLTTDQRGTGFDRLIDGNDDGTARIDLGAFERPIAGELVITQSGGSTQVGEASPSDTFTVALNRRPVSPVTVNLQVGSPQIVTTSAASLTFTTSNWDQPQTVTVSGIPDSDITGNRTTSISAAIDNATSDDDFDGLSQSISVTVFDDDAAQPTISIADAAAVDEGANAVFTVTLSEASSSTVTVEYSTASGSGANAATIVDDFASLLSQTLTFAAGETQKQINVPTVDDGEIEETETFRVLLTNSLGATPGTTTATGTINNIDVARPIVTAPTGASDNVRPTITWQAVDGAASYELWLERLGDDGNPVVNPTVTGTSFTLDVDLTVARYRAWVRANLAAGGRTPWGTGDFQVNTAPVLNSLKSQHDAVRPQISWDALAGVTGYRIFIQNQTSGEVAADEIVTNPTFTPSADLSFGRHHIWVRGIGPGGYQAAWSAVERHTVGPALIGPVISTFDTQPQFSWESVAGAGSYQLYVQIGRTVVINETGITSTSFTPSSPFDVGLHRWWIRPFHSNGTAGGWSARGDFYVGGRTTITQPTAIVTDALATIRWDPVDGADSYEVYLYNDDGVGLVQRVAGITGATFTADPVVDGNYRVWVRPLRTSATDGFWSRPASFVVDAATSTATATPVSPVIPTFDSTPTFEWTGQNGAATYDLYLTNGETIVQQTGLTSRTWTPPTALAAGPWHWWVRALNSAGAAGQWSSQQTTDTSGRAVITGPTGSTSDRTPTIAWTPVTGATQYVFQLDNVTGGQDSIIRENNVASASFTVGAALQPGSYRAWVRAVNGTTNTNAPWSLVWVFEIV